MIPRLPMAPHRQYWTSSNPFLELEIESPPSESSATGLESQGSKNSHRLTDESLESSQKSSPRVLTDKLQALAIVEKRSCV